MKEQTKEIENMSLQVIPLTYASKIPAKGCNWRDKAQSVDISSIDTTKQGVGLVLGENSGIVAIDLDDDIDNLHSEIMKIAGLSPVGKRGKKGATYFYRYNGEKKRQYNKGVVTVMDLLGEGSYTVLPPSIHPETKRPYTYTTDKQLHEIDLNILPYLPTDFVDKIDKLFGKTSKSSLTEYQVSLSSSSEVELKELLTFVKPEGYEVWLNIGMILKKEHGEEAFNLWNEWSSTGSTYNPEEMVNKWASFKDIEGGLTIATLYKYAMDNGYRPDKDLYTTYQADKKIQDWLENGFPIGEYVGIPQMQDKEGLDWHLRKKELTVITGYPGSGKSEFLHYLLYKTTKNLNYKTLFASFEGGRAKLVESFYHRYSGKRLSDRSEEEYKEAKNFVNSNCFFIDPYKHNKIESIIEIARRLKNKLDIDILVVDPFSKLTSDLGSTESDMGHVKHVVNSLSTLAKQLDIHIFLVAHPSKQKDSGFSGIKLKSEKVKTLTLRDISGGAVFHNTCDNGIVVTRLGKDSLVTFLKIKEQEYDKLGEFKMTYNRETRRFDTFEEEY